MAAFGYAIHMLNLDTSRAYAKGTPGGLHLDAQTPPKSVVIGWGGGQVFSKLLLYFIFKPSLCLAEYLIYNYLGLQKRVINLHGVKSYKMHVIYLIVRGI